MSSIKLYGTLGCHLCEDAEAWLQHFYPSVSFTKIDIASDERLVELYGLRIPTLQIGDAVMDWPFTQIEAQSLFDKLTVDTSAQPKTRRVFTLGAENLSTEK